MYSRVGEYMPQRNLLNFNLVFPLLFWTWNYFFTEYSDRRLKKGSFKLWGRKVKVKVAQSCLILCNPVGCSPLDSSIYGDSPGQDTGMGSLSLLQRIFPTQGSNPGLPHCQRMLYHLNHQESPSILEWVACPFSSGSFRPRNWTGVSCIAGRFFNSWATRKARAEFLIGLSEVIQISFFGRYWTASAGSRVWERFKGYMLKEGKQLRGENSSPSEIGGGFSKSRRKSTFES